MTEKQLSGNLAPTKTTLDLPDELMREVKIRAGHEHKKLNDTIVELLRKGIAAGRAWRPKTPKPVKLRGGFVPAIENTEARFLALAEQLGRRLVSADDKLRAAAPALTQWLAVV